MRYFHLLTQNGFLSNINPEIGVFFYILIYYTGNGSNMSSFIFVLQQFQTETFGKRSEVFQRSEVFHEVNLFTFPSQARIMASANAKVRSAIEKMVSSKCGHYASVSLTRPATHGSPTFIYSVYKLKLTNG